MGDVRLVHYENNPNSDCSIQVISLLLEVHSSYGRPAIVRLCRSFFLFFVLKKPYGLISLHSFHGPAELGDQASLLFCQFLGVQGMSCPEVHGDMISQFELHI